jgi:hypothetical protein
MDHQGTCGSAFDDQYGNHLSELVDRIFERGFIRQPTGVSLVGH